MGSQVQGRHTDGLVPTRSGEGTEKKMYMQASETTTLGFNATGEFQTYDFFLLFAGIEFSFVI